MINIDAFSNGQMDSKLWLCRELENLGWDSNLTRILEEITKKYNDFLDAIFAAYPTAITNGGTQLGDWVEYTSKDRQ